MYYQRGESAQYRLMAQQIRQNSKLIARRTFAGVMLARVRGVWTLVRGTPKTNHQ